MLQTNELRVFISSTLIRSEYRRGRSLCRERGIRFTEPPTPLEQERSRHESFSLSRRRAYIANPVYLKKLNDHAASDAPPLIVYAESGSGKSSLFAFWAEQYRRKNPEAHVIEHYVGIGATSTDHYAVIRHCCMEINERFGRTEEIPSEPAKLDLALGQWLGYADHELKKRGESMVLILDGLNQLQGAALGLKWIPDVISPSIRLVLSSTVEGTLVELQKRGWGRFGMQALSEPERETIVVRYLAEYHKSLNPEQIKRIATDYKCGHPLFLKTVLEELRLVGHHEELDAKIESYLETTGTEDLFQRVLERLEDDYSQRAVRDVMVLLSASRSGLDERELSELSGLARLKIATMMARLDYHLVRKEGRLTFFHDYLRRAVEKRYLTDAAKQRTIHVQIAEYFQSGVTASIVGGGRVPQRMASELAYQLHAAGSIDRLRECLSSMPVFLTLYDGPTVYEVLRYWTGMDADTDVAGSYRRGLASWGMEDAGERSRGVGQVANLLERLGRWLEAIELGRERLAGAIELGEKSEEAASRGSMGWLLILRGAYSEAVEELRQALDLSTELGDRRGVSGAIGNMGVVYSRRGEYDRALEHFHKAAEEHRELGVRDALSDWLQETANVLLEITESVEEMPEYLPIYIPGANGETWRVVCLQRAQECAEECVAISEELQKPDTLFASHVLQARIEAAEGRVEGAVEQLGAMLSEANEDEQRAELQYWLWKIEGSADGGAEVLLLYTGLFEKTPKHDYQQRIAELSGTTNSTPSTADTP